MEQGMGTFEEPVFVICIWNKPNPASLELRKLYSVVPDAAAETTGMVRVIDESGEDYMYPSKWFIPVDLPDPVMKAVGAAGSDQ
jgi:hypothetical protein